MNVQRMPARVQLKPLDEQTIVITGASSGIGLATALAAAERGARVVLVSRDPDDLEQAAERVRQVGGEVHTVVIDVADRAGVEFVVQEVERTFGDFDTWINNAGGTLFGRLVDTPEEDARQIFETNYWGVVHGCEAAVEHLGERGGAIINIGSVTSGRAVPLQGHYSASKHAVKGYTDALRMEIEKDGLLISVTLVKPSSTDTPFPEHARNLMDEEPTLPAPVYAPEVVADAILRCCEKPVREITVGAGGGMFSSLGALFPRLTDRLMEAVMFDQQKLDEPARHREGALHEPASDGANVRGENVRGRVLKSSLYTQMALRPGMVLAGAAAVGVGLAALLRR
jgi:short-subunit dehydrogenase